MESNFALQWNNLLKMTSERPYVFRTRLERLLLKTITFANLTGNDILKAVCINTKNKLNYISDQSNHTADGILRSFIVLKDDMESIYKLVAN